MASVGGAYMKQGTFFENSAIITGASLGIGRELALQLAEQGAWLTLAARSTDKLEETAELCREQGGKAISVTTDVADPNQCQALIERSKDEYGRIDTLINNAGIAMRAWFQKLPDFSVLDTVMQINFWGSVYCTYYALPYLKETKGRIVAVISGFGLFPSPTACGYGASKHAQAGFFDSLRIELAQSGVTVTNIYPEWVATGISARALGKDGNPIGKMSAQEQRGMAPEAYTRMVLKAIAKRQHHLMPTKYKLGLMLAPIFPGIMDRIASQMV
jgi:short-subunit dehydrogenase